MKKFTNTLSGATLLTRLSDAGYSASKVKQLLKHRAIAVNDIPASRPDHPLSPGDMISIATEKEMQRQTMNCPGLTILYEDADIVVIDKPAGLLSIATDKEKRKTAFYLLSAYLKEKHQSERERIFIVHRLDQGTSGLLVFARNETAKQLLQEQWEQADKKYVAVVEGIPSAKEGTITSHLAESSAFRVYSVKGKSETGKEAVTGYRVLRECATHAMLEVHLFTGRKNQIRVHMADIGHPIAGDKKYGAKTNPLRRLALHARSLSFNHPTIEGKRMEFELPIPGKFYTLFTAKTL